jgi:hypothetical protein
MENTINQDDIIEFILPNEGSFTVDELAKSIIKQSKRKHAQPFSGREA